MSEYQISGGEPVTVTLKEPKDEEEKEEKGNPPRDSADRGARKRDLLGRCLGNLQELVPPLWGESPPGPLPRPGLPEVPPAPPADDARSHRGGEEARRGHGQLQQPHFPQSPGHRNSPNDGVKKPNR